jgi:hypothetical protein
MYEPDSVDSLLGPRLRVLQIIAATLLAGVLTFLVVVIVLVQQRGQGLGQPGDPVVTYVALAFFVTQVGVWAFLPASLARKRVLDLAATTAARGPGAAPAGELLAVFQTKTIISYAMLEGVAFFGCIAYLLEGDVLALAVVAAPVLLMLLTFPTRPRVLSWLGQQQARLEERARPAA